MDILALRWEDSCELWRLALDAPIYRATHEREAQWRKSPAHPSWSIPRTSTPRAGSRRRSRGRTSRRRLQDEAGADLFLEIARIQNGERDDRTVKVTWSREELEDLLRRASGDAVTLTFDQDELERMLDDPTWRHTACARRSSCSASQPRRLPRSPAPQAHRYERRRRRHQRKRRCCGMVTDASTGGVAGSVSGFTTDASTSGTAADAAAPAAAPADGWMSGVESPVPGPPASTSSPTTRADSPGRSPGSPPTRRRADSRARSRQSSRTPAARPRGHPRRRLSAAEEVGSPFRTAPSKRALAGGLALLITGAAFVTRTQRRRPSTA